MAEKPGELREYRADEETGLTAREFGDAEAAEDADEIKAKIEETRSNMGETIDAIQERLSFSNLSEQVSEQVGNAIETAKDTVYDATIGKAVNYMKYAGNEISTTTIGRAVKDNPLPYALIGLGSGLLLYKSFSTKQRSAGFDTRHLTDRNEGRKNGGVYNTVSSKLSDAAGTVSGAAENAVDTVSSAAHSAADTVAGAASTTYAGARDLASKAYEKAGEFGSTAHDTYDHYIEENPLAVGAVALAVGAAVGFALPSTRYEGELMGEARQNLLSKAEATASGFVDKAKEIASDAGKAVKDEVSGAIEGNETKTKTVTQGRFS
jgi:ElaB/YqjD/DUF883 family membrane-anchored ribosome-binding protein